MTSVLCPSCQSVMVFKESQFECTKCDWKVSRFQVEAESSIVKILEKEKVVYRNEFRYRLEKQFYHTVTDFAVRRLEQGKPYREGLKLARTALPGRRSSVKRTPNVFYKLPGADYTTLKPVMKRKLELSTFISELSSSAGFHAQYLWRDAFAKLGFNIIKEDVKEFEGRKASVGGDIDFIAEKDGLNFGVEVKNSLEYPNDLAKKVQIAVELGTIPLMVVRRVTWDVYGNLKKFGVLTKIYETSIMPGCYKSVVDQCIKELEMPLIALDVISEGSTKHLEEKVLSWAVKKPGDFRARNNEYLKTIKEFRKKMQSVDKELKFT